MAFAVVSITPNQIGHRVHAAGRGRREGVELTLLVHHRQLVRELPWIAGVTVIVAFPCRAILVTEIAALWRQLAVGNTSHDVFDGFAADPLDITGHQFVRCDGEFRADGNWFAPFTGDVIAFAEAQELANDMARRNRVGIRDERIDARLR